MNQKIRIEQLKHDIAVLDTAIYFNKERNIKINQITTELELHRKDGFGLRKHRPDFIYTENGKTTCVEIELTMKAKDRFETNIKNNFLEYDNQIWIVPSMNTKIADILNSKITEYPTIEIIELQEITKNE